MKFKDSEAKFSSHLVERWAECIDILDKISCNYNLIDEQKRQYLHNLVRSGTTRFYAIAVEPHTATFRIAAHMRTGSAHRTSQGVR